VSRRRVLEAVFILLEFPSPSRRIFIGSHSLPPSLVRRIGPSTASASGWLTSPSPSLPRPEARRKTRWKRATRAWKGRQGSTQPLSPRWIAYYLHGSLPPSTGGPPPRSQGAAAPAAVLLMLSLVFQRDGKPTGVRSVLEARATFPRRFPTPLHGGSCVDRCGAPLLLQHGRTLGRRARATSRVALLRSLFHLVFSQIFGF
jgi:hypothetical protein